jgi:hypothetical protein
MIEFVDVKIVLMMMNVFPSRQQMDGSRAVEGWDINCYKENQSMACHA